MPARATREVQDRSNASPFNMGSDELYCAGGVRLVAVGIEAKIFLPEPLFEPVGLLSRFRPRAALPEARHLWYGSPRTMVPAR